MMTHKNLIWGARHWSPAWCGLFLAGCMSTSRPPLMTQRVPEDAAPLGAQLGTSVAAPSAAAPSATDRATPVPQKAHVPSTVGNSDQSAPGTVAARKPAVPDSAPAIPLPTQSPPWPAFPSTDRSTPGNGGPGRILPRIDPDGITVPRNLELTVSAPPRKQVGTQATFRLTVRNTGDQPADEVTVHCAFDAPLEFPGSEEHEVKQKVGRLLPHESKEVALSLACDQAGAHCSRFSVRLDNEEQAVAVQTACVEFVPRQLEIELRGPAQRSVGSRAEFNIQVANRSDDLLPNVQVVATFDAALVPREANSDAERTPGRVTWNLGRLQAHEGVQLQVEFECSTPAHRACVLVETVGPQAAGEQVESCLEIVPVPGILDVRVNDKNDPFVVGKTGTYEITVQNIGLQAARDLVLEVIPGDSLSVLSAEVKRQGEPLRLPYRTDEGRIVFDPIDELAPDAVLTFVVEAKALSAGHIELQALLRSPLSQTPVSVTEPSTILEE